MSKFTDFFKKHPLTKHICYILLVALLLIVIVLIWLMSYTNHGEQQVVPDVVGLRVESAANLFDGKSLKYEVVDSVYSDAVPKGTIVEQDPAAGSMVKQYRKIYLITNAVLDEMVAIPEVTDISIRQAGTILEASGFRIDKVTYKPSEYNDLVLGVYYRGKQIMPGETLQAGSGIELYVGSNELDMEQDSITTMEGTAAGSLEEEITF